MDQMRRSQGASAYVPNGEDWETGRSASATGGSMFDQIKSTLAEKLHSAAGTIEQQASGMRGGSNESYGRYGQTAADWMNRSADYIRDADVERLKSDVTDQVRQNPGRTLLIAGAAGLVLGALLRRR